jgi:hypothetical protein
MPVCVRDADYVHCGLEDSDVNGVIDFDVLIVMTIMP